MAEEAEEVVESVFVCVGGLERQKQPVVSWVTDILWGGAYPTTRGDVRCLP